MDLEEHSVHPHVEFESLLYSLQWAIRNLDEEHVFETRPLIFDPPEDVYAASTTKRRNSEAV